MHRTESLRATVGACSFPDDLVAKLIRSEHCVHQHLQVITGLRITVKIDSSRRFHGAAQFH